MIRGMGIQAVQFVFLMLLVFVAMFARGCGTPGREHFRTINVQRIGRMAFLAVVADPRINKLHVINAANRPTPAASTMSFRINYLRAL
jgi:hypothetical protein